MNLPGLTTILNNAPLIIQGASKLLKIIHDRGQHAETTPADKVDETGSDIKKIQARLDANDDSSIEQIKLIEQLAEQNKTLANSLQTTVRRLTVVSIIAVAAFFITVGSLIYFLMQ